MGGSDQKVVRKTLQRAREQGEYVDIIFSKTPNDESKWCVVRMKGVKIRDKPKETGDIVGRLQPAEVILGIKDGKWIKHRRGYSRINKNGELRLLKNKRILVIVTCDILGKSFIVNQNFML